jgi:hypothetical protein
MALLIRSKRLDMTSDEVCGMNFSNRTDETKTIPQVLPSAQRRQKVVFRCVRWLLCCCAAAVGWTTAGGGPFGRGAPTAHTRGRWVIDARPPRVMSFFWGPVLPWQRRIHLALSTDWCTYSTSSRTPKKKIFSYFWSSGHAPSCLTLINSVMKQVAPHAIITQLLLFFFW